ncbi:MAG: nitroreductase family protein [Candidatus Obscuribacterales bacterium]|nr:nitroreductase family protein [Candidatus Obscuribacterales bacterium]
MYNIDETIKARHSIRKFLPRPVPKDLLFECLELAQLAPSNSNIQPWRLFIAAGAERDRLQEALLAVAREKAPNVPALPEHFTHFRSELGAQVYGVGMGIASSDKEARRAAVLRNWEFFGAPVVAIVCMDKELGPADALGVGMYLQTLVLALTARGLAACVQVALAGYPEVIYRELEVPRQLSILCGVSIGYPDLEFPVNKLKIGRALIANNVMVRGY